MHLHTGERGEIMKIAVISDLHCSDTVITPANPPRHGHVGIQILEKAIARINSEDRPDILLVGGDLTNLPADVHHLDACAGVLKNSACPVVIIPGNHDPKPEIFYQHMPRPQDYYDIKGIRVIPFPDDLHTAGCNALRPEKGMQRMAKLADGSMPTVIFQHVPIFRFEQDHIACPYNYENAAEIIDFAAKNRVVLAISGHYHPAFGPYYMSPLPALAVPSLCETPFFYALCELDSDGSIISYTLKRACTAVE